MKKEKRKAKKKGRQAVRAVKKTKSSIRLSKARAGLVRNDAGKAKTISPKAFIIEQDLALNKRIFDSPERNSTRQALGEALIDLARENNDVVVLTADLAESTKTDLFAKAFPDRFFDVGIAEQDMMGISCGLALSGKIPFASTFAMFAAGRAWEQIHTSIAYTQANVKIAATHAGITTGEDGATNQALSDIALMRTIPNMTVIVPCDYEQAKKAVFAAAEKKGPVYIRLGRPSLPIVTTDETHFDLGRADIYVKGKDVMIIATGEMVYEALVAAKNLCEKGVSAGVMNMHTLKPLDSDSIIDAANAVKIIVTAEDHHMMGGLGSAVAEVMAGMESKKAYQLMIGINDYFGKSGSCDELMKEYHITSFDIVETVLRAMRD